MLVFNVLILLHAGVESDCRADDSTVVLSHAEGYRAMHKQQRVFSKIVHSGQETVMGRFCFERIKHNKRFLCPIDARHQ